MFGLKAIELIKEAKRSQEGTLPPYNEEGIRKVLEEMRALFEQNQAEVNEALEGDQDLFVGIQIRHVALEQNKRCILAYLNHRLETIKQLRWELGSVLPQDVKQNLTTPEAQWFSKYSKGLAKYMRSLGNQGGVDLTLDVRPPKTLHIQVRCLEDHGEFETQDGNIILLKKNSQHFLLRSECEHLIRQGILEHIIT
ncbi:hypothetical protein CAPTEDRAFT_196861 [Capitella teleta]|uniref:DNA replication complex GINS protein PSF1 n=1 Tax=Capitella teleta TaxID=283909 RepID=R7VH77_CAPTE|nr:hypothetical protein CAPTEDRAFT_163156 [Capitella teleta]ELU17932.1 hypothetical protein CAPTEDRAFT_196861 [Capitella teleta]|eukprot:ELU00601.1 hypothetical protein CAPTEDRAFT_163156 [Capitella teleta]